MPTIPGPLYDDDGRVSLAVYDYLEETSPEERTEMVLKLIEERPYVPLALSGRDGRKANLQGIDLSAKAIAKRATGRNYRPKWAIRSKQDRLRAKLDHAHLEGASLDDSHLEGAYLVGAHLDGAYLNDAHLEGANLRNVCFRDAAFDGAHLEGADLSSAHLEHVDLTPAYLDGISISEAWLDNTRLFRSQLGVAVGEELRTDYVKARQAYLNLKQNFESLGDYEASSWVYRKERRMEKLEARAQKRYGKFVGDQIVEWVCDYGEGWRNVIGWIAFFWMFFALLYGLSGYVLTPGTPEITTISASTAQQGSRYVVTHNTLHWLVFSLATMVTIELPALVPSSEPWMSLLMPVQALLGIFLAGLLGFVAGNRIRRS
jgi:hypothetical protein